MIYNSNGNRNSNRSTRSYSRAYTGINQLMVELEQDNFNLFEACVYTELDHNRLIREGYLTEESADDKSKREWKNFVETIKAFFRKLSVKIQEIFNNFYIMWLKHLTKDGKIYQKQGTIDKLNANMAKSYANNVTPTKFTGEYAKLKYSSFYRERFREDVIKAYRNASACKLSVVIDDYLYSLEKKRSTDASADAKKTALKKSLDEYSLEDIGNRYRKDLLNALSRQIQEERRDSTTGKITQKEVHAGTVDLTGLSNTFFAQERELNSWDELLQAFMGEGNKNEKTCANAKGSYLSVIKDSFEDAMSIKAANKAAQAAIKADIADADGQIQTMKFDFAGAYESGDTLEAQARTVCSRILRVCSSIKQEVYVKLCKVICDTIKRVYIQDKDVVKAVLHVTESGKAICGELDYNTHVFNEEFLSGRAEDKVYYMEIAGEDMNSDEFNDDMNDIDYSSDQSFESDDIEEGFSKYGPSKFII